MLIDSHGGCRMSEIWWHYLLKYVYLIHVIWGFSTSSLRIVWPCIIWGFLFPSVPPSRRKCSYTLGPEDPLEEEMATYSSVLAWKTPWTEEPGGLQSMVSQRIRQNWAHTHALFHGEDFSQLLFYIGLFQTADYLLIFHRLQIKWWSFPTRCAG